MKMNLKMLNPIFALALGQYFQCQWHNNHRWTSPYNRNRLLSSVYYEDDLFRIMAGRVTRVLQPVLIGSNTAWSAAGWCPPLTIRCWDNQQRCVFISYHSYNQSIIIHLIQSYFLSKSNKVFQSQLSIKGTE